MVHKPFSSSTMSTAASMIQNHRRSSNGSSAEYELSSSVRPRRQEGQGTRTNGSNPLLTASTINSSYNAMDYDNTAAISSTMPRFPNVPGRPDREGREQQLPSGTGIDDLMNPHDSRAVLLTTIKAALDILKKIDDIEKQEQEN